MAKFLSIPGLIAIGSLTACADPIVGDWEMQETTTFEGTYQTYDYNYYENVDCFYTQTATAELAVADDLSAELDYDYDFAGSCSGSTSGTFQLEGIIVPGGDGMYELEVEDGDGNELEFDCEMNAAGTELVCDLDGNEYVFEKK